MTAPEAKWLTTREVAERSRRHVTTIHKAAEAGALHGHQTKRGGRWQFKPAAVDAWIEGSSSAAACGCRRLRSARRAA